MPRTKKKTTAKKSKKTEKTETSTVTKSMAKDAAKSAIEAMEVSADEMEHKMERESKDVLKEAGIEKLRIPKPKKIRRVHYIIENVPNENCFVVVDGTKINNLKELAEVLEHMKEETFVFHSNEDKNDFSNWIKDVIGEIELAEKLHMKSKKETHTEVLKHIVHKLT